MARLPTVGDDLNAWGTVLNDFLEVAHNADGTLKGAIEGNEVTTLSVSATSGTTSAVLSSVAEITVGQMLAIGAGTSTCEVRRVTAISSTTATLHTALKFSHADGQLVRIFDFWASPLWWGAQPSPSVDSFRNLSNMFIDQQTAGIGTYGIRGLGHTLPFYTTTPLWVSDFWWSEHFGLTAMAPFAFSCTAGVWTYDNWPHQHLLNASGQFGTVSTVSITADSITFSATPGSLEGDEVAFYVREGKGTIPAGLTEGRTYYLKTNVTGNEWTLSIDKWGASTVNITDVGTGEVVWWSTGSSRVNADRLYLSGGGKAAGVSVDGKTGGIRGLNGFRGTLQQQSRLTDCRFELFAGFACSIDGQQSNWYNAEIINNARGAFRNVGGKFLYMYGCNYEGSDINFEFADMAEGIAPGHVVYDAGVSDILLSGSHFESPGRGSFLVQTITITGIPASGTFDLKAARLSGSTTDTIGTLNWNATAADAQTICDAYFGAGNMVVTGGALPGAQLTFTFSGAYAYGWGMVLSVANSTVAGGSYTVSIINPNGRQISFKGGRQIVIDSAIDSSNTNPVTNTAIDFFVVEGAAATNNSYGNYELRNIYGLSTNGNFVTDPLRTNCKRDDGDLGGASTHLFRWFGFGRHDLGVGRQWWAVGDGGRYVAIGASSAAGIQINGASATGSQLLKLTPGVSATGNAIESYDTAGALQFLVAPNGAIRLGGATGPLIFAYTATPESVFSGPPGSMCLNSNGGAATSLYVKQTATAATTGWAGK